MTAACTGHALCSAMQLHYSTALGVVGTSGALMVLLTGERAVLAARRRPELRAAHDHGVVGSTPRRRFFGVARIHHGCPVEGGEPETSPGGCYGKRPRPGSKGSGRSLSKVGLMVRAEPSPERSA